MEALKICLTAVLSVAELFILTKIMGKRQISQLSLFDYINGITIGSIAAEMAFSPLETMWKPALAVAVYGFIAVLLSFVSNKSASFRRVFEGKAVILMDNGKIYRRNLTKSKIDINEFLEQCRINGYFNLDDLQTVIMEANGQLSFLPKADRRPVNPRDIGLMPESEQVPVVVISDGNILQNNLKTCGKNEIWLREQLKSDNCPPPDKIFLAIYDGTDKLYTYEINNGNKKRDIFC